MTNLNTDMSINSKLIEIDPESKNEIENTMNYIEDCDLGYSSNLFNTKIDKHNDKDIINKLYNTETIKNTTELDKKILSLNNDNVFNINIDDENKDNSQILYDEDNDDEFNYLLEKSKFKFSALNEEMSWQIISQTMQQLNPYTYMNAYISEKKHLRLNECAKLAKTLHTRISTNELWIAEEEALINSMRNKEKDINYEIFTLMNSDLQYNIMSSVYRRHPKDFKFCCFIICFMVKKWPQKSVNEAISLICLLIKEETSSEISCAVNIYRKFIVVDLLPTILVQRCHNIPGNLLLVLLQKSMEYYFYEYFQDGIFNAKLKTTHPLHYTSPSCNGIHHWQPLEYIFIQSANHLKWNFNDFFSLNYNDQLKYNINLRNELLESARKKESTPLDNDHLKQQLFYVSMLSFLRLAAEYVSTVCPIVKDENYCGPLINILFAFDEQLFADKSLEKPYINQEYPAPLSKASASSSASSSTTSLASSSTTSFSSTYTSSTSYNSSSTSTSSSSSATSTMDVIINFDVNDRRQIESRRLLLACMRYWQMMMETPFMQQHQCKLFKCWSLDKCGWMSIVFGDISMCTRNYDNAISIFSSIKTTHIKLRERIQLQIAMCNYMKNNYKLSLDTISSLFVARLAKNGNQEENDLNNTPLHPQSQLSSIKHAKLLNRLFGPKNSITMITCSLYPDYMVHFIINYHWSLAFSTELRDDISMGHLMVMLQYDWPRYKPIYERCLQRISKRNSFNYKIFYDYIKSIPIMAGLSMLEKKNKNMNLCLVPQKKKSKRSMTRHMTKTQDLAKSNSVFRNVRKSCKFAIENSIEEFLLMLCKLNK